MRPQLGDVLQQLKPRAEWAIRGDEIEWLDEEQSKPSQEEIDDKMAEMEAEYDALQYQRDRKPEYPSMADQLDYIYHNGIAKWKSDMVKPVKDAHPKP